MDLSPIWISLQLASVTVVVLLIVGTPLAWWLAHTRSRSRAVVEAIVALPLVLPPTVLGFYLLILMGPASTIGGLWVSLTDTTLTFSFALTKVVACLFDKSVVNGFILNSPDLKYKTDLFNLVLLASVSLLLKFVILYGRLISISVSLILSSNNTRISGVFFKYLSYLYIASALLTGLKHETSSTIDKKIKTSPYTAYLIFLLSMVNSNTPLLEGYYLPYSNFDSEKNFNFFQLIIMHSLSNRRII